MNIIWGYGANPHITAQQLRDTYVGIFGDDTHILDVGSKMAATIVMHQLWTDGITDDPERHTGNAEKRFDCCTIYEIYWIRSGEHVTCGQAWHSCFV